MRYRRRPIRSLSGWLTVLLLFTQIATAAYACPATVAAAHAQVAMAEMPGCDGGAMPATMDADQPQLCQAHCQPDAQNVHPTLALDAPTTPLLLAVLDWTATARLPAQAACGWPLAALGGSPPGSPPRYLALLVLRN